MNLNQINTNAVNSLHHFFKNDYLKDDLKTSNQSLSNEEITNSIKKQAESYRQKHASLEVLRKNINIKAHSSLARYFK